MLARAAGLEWQRLIEIDFDAFGQGSKTPYKLRIYRAQNLRALINVPRKHFEHEFLPRFHDVTAPLPGPCARSS